MTFKLSTVFMTALLLGVGLMMLIFTTSCGSVYTDNTSDRPWADTDGPPGFLKGSRREDR